MRKARSNLVDRNRAWRQRARELGGQRSFLRAGAGICGGISGSGGLRSTFLRSWSSGWLGDRVGRWRGDCVCRLEGDIRIQRSADAGILYLIDGLALGETTPGPLIMVVAFVGFVGAYVSQVFGADQVFLAGAVAAALVTWFTFLPSFLFILAGGPLVESTHNELKFTAPLTAITAAVVGVILNLACFFGYHVLWPKGFSGNLDWPSAVIAIAAAIALFRFKRGVIQVLMACALAGLAVHLLR